MIANKRRAERTRYKPVFPGGVLDVSKYLIRETTINNDEIKDTARSLNDVLVLIARIQSILKDGILWSESDPTSGFALAFFGTGIDGDVTVSSTVDLNRDMYYNNLTVESGGVINTNGYRVFVRNKLTLDGNINNDGNDVSAVLGRGASGGVGSSSTGANGDDINNTLSIGGVGAQGGDGGDSDTPNAGGSGGTVASSVSNHYPKDGVSLLRGFVEEGLINGGAGGGAGGGNGVEDGGAGGEGGGVVVVVAREIIINTGTGPGTISANGGNGESTSSGAGGGGGGGGGVAMVLSSRVYDTDIEDTTSNAFANYITSDGGSGGAASGAGSTAGDDGNSGTVVEVII